MLLATTGIVINEYGNVLLIQRNDTRTMAPPGGSMDSGELPTESVVREVREETGLIVMPVRLVAVHFWPTGPHGILSFVFRCIQRGGELASSGESLQVGFYSMSELPRPMFAMHRRRIQQALDHQGGPPYWGVQKGTWSMRLTRWLLINVIYRSMDVKRRISGQPRYQGPSAWRATGQVVVRRADDKILWVRDKASEPWRLPAAEGKSLEAPWTVAHRAVHGRAGFWPRLTDLCGVYIGRQDDHVRFVFTAEAGAKRAKEWVDSELCAFLETGDSGKAFLGRDLGYVRDACDGDSLTRFRHEESSDGS